MAYLILASFFSASVALLFKYSESKGFNRFVVATINYIAGFFVSLIIVISKGIFLTKGIKINKFLNEFGAVLKTGGVLSPGSSIVWAIIVGVVAGIFFFVAFIFYQKSVKENGVATTGTVRSLNVLIPMTLSMVLWLEIPNMWQWFGIGIAVFSIVLFSLSSIKELKRKLHSSLYLFYITGGTSQFLNKLYQKYGIVEYRSIFLLVVFFVASLIGVSILIKNRVKIRKSEIVVGFFVGLSNLFQNSLMILSFSIIKSSVAFPIFSAMSIFILNVGGWLIFKEYLSKIKIFAIVLAILSIFLISLR